ncbi:MAG TPA: cadherin repeat domain-containing protein, partial [Microvirga sp.]|nr:cadherin repeat domain-containing protein [Microvirga sp.]
MPLYVGSASVTALYVGSQAVSSAYAGAAAAYSSTPAAPANVSVPTIDDTTPTVGDVLTASPGAWSGSPAPIFAYQWKRGATNVGTDSPNYTVLAGDVGSTLTVMVTATNASGSASATSAATSAVVAAPVVDTTPPTITSTNAHSVNENAVYNATATANETVTWAKGGTDAGLVTLNTSTGAWSVAAQDRESRASVVFTLTATDTAGNASSPQTVTLTINNVLENTLAALSLSPNTATVGVAYSGTLTGRTAGSTLSLSGTGAAGLSINNTTGAVTGTPTTAGAVNVVETIADATNSPRTSSGAITVTAASAPTAPVVTWSTGPSDNTPEFDIDLTSPQVGDVVTLEISASNTFTSPTTYTDTLDSGEVAAGE